MRKKVYLVGGRVWIMATYAHPGAKGLYKPEQLLASAEILKAMAEEFDFGKEKKVHFARHAYLG